MVSPIFQAELPSPALPGTSALDPLMPTHIDQQRRRIQDCVPVTGDEFSRRLFNRASSLVEDAGEALHMAQYHRTQYHRNWLLNKLTSNIDGITAKKLSKAIRDLHEQFELSMRYRGCDYINSPKPNLHEHVKGAKNLALALLEQAGVNPWSCFGEIVEWMIRVHDAGEILGEFSSESERRSEPSRHDKNLRASLEKQIAYIALALKIDAILTPNSNQFEAFLEQGRQVRGDANGIEAMKKVEGFLKLLKESRLKVDGRAKKLAKRLMVFYDAVEKGEGFAALFAKTVEKLETYAYVAFNCIEDKFTIKDIQKTLEYPAKVVKALQEAARESRNSVLIQIANHTNNYYLSNRSRLEKVLQNKNAQTVS